MLADLKTKIMPVRECLVPAPYRVPRSAESLTVPILEYLQSSRSKRKMHGMTNPCKGIAIHDRERCLARLRNNRAIFLAHRAKSCQSYWHD